MANSDSTNNPQPLTDKPFDNEEYLDFLLGKRTLEEAPVLDHLGRPLKALPACPLARSMAIYERTTLASITISYYLWNPS